MAINIRCDRNGTMPQLFLHVGRRVLVHLGLRDELLNGEIFCTLKEAQILIEHWRREYNK